MNTINVLMYKTITESWKHGLHYTFHLEGQKKTEIQLQYYNASVFRCAWSVCSGVYCTQSYFECLAIESLARDNRSTFLLCTICKFAMILCCKYTQVYSQSHLELTIALSAKCKSWLEALIHDNYVNVLACELMKLGVHVKYGWMCYCAIAKET